MQCQMGQNKIQGKATGEQSGPYLNSNKKPRMLDNQLTHKHTRPYQAKYPLNAELDFNFLPLSRDHNRLPKLKVIYCYIIICEPLPLNVLNVLNSCEKLQQDTQ